MTFRKIAAEEAFSIRSVAERLGEVVRTMPGVNLDLPLLRMIYDDPDPDSAGGIFRRRLLDLEQERLEVMDANGVDMQLLSLTSPGVQMFDADTAAELAIEANDVLAETIHRHPTRFAGLGSFAPHAPQRAAREIERATQALGLNGFIVNSHTNGEYLDDPKFWEIFEAAEAMNRALYIHPRAPSDHLAGAFRSYGMEAAMWGYGVETGTHALRLICSGLLDRFPKLRVVLGHMGEGIPFWLWRIDFMHAAMTRRGRTPRLELTPSEYFKRNFAITTSGQENPDALDYSIKTLGVENVMWAVDYPYQPTEPAVAFMDAASLPDAQKRLVYGGNAERVFHIAAAP